jgi:hypothetical protein
MLSTGISFCEVIDLNHRFLNFIEKAELAIRCGKYELWKTSMRFLPRPRQINPRTSERGQAIKWELYT